MTFSINCIDAIERELLHDTLALRIEELDTKTEELMEMSDSAWRSKMLRDGVMLPKGFGRENYVEHIAEERGRVRGLQRIIEEASACD